MLLEGDIFVIDVKSGHEVLIEDVKEMISTAGTIGGGRKLKNLIVANEYASMSSEATAYMKTEEAHRFTKSEAVVINSLAQRIVGNFYLAIVSQTRPSKLFNEVDKAIDWLEKQ